MDPVEHAAEIMTRYIRDGRVRRAYLMFSGGKDSTVLLLATSMLPRELRDKIIVVYNVVTGNTHEWNIQFAFYAMRDIFGCDDLCVITSPPYENVYDAVMRGCKCIAVVARTYFGGNFWDAVARWGVPFPRRSRHRWCANEFKHKHWDALPASYVDDRPHRIIVTGIRADESSSRRKYAYMHRDYAMMFYNHASKTVDVNVVPLVDAPERDVIDALKQYGVWSRMTAYIRAGDSLNCVYCPMRTVEKQSRIIDAIAETTTGCEIIRRAIDALRRSIERCGPVTCAIAKIWLDASIHALTRIDRRIDAVKTD